MQSSFLRSLIFPWLLALLLVILGPTPATQAAANLNVDRVDDPALTVGGVGAAACTPDENDCSLRGAILFTNASLGDAFVINIPTGTYTLTLTGAGEDYNLTGDLDITHHVTIAGAGASATIIDANNLDRVLDTRPGNSNIRISGVTIKGGKATDGAVATGPAGGGSGENGGGIRNTDTASLTLTNVIVAANHAGSGGAGATEGTFGTAYPGGPGGMGGGIYSTGALTVISTTISSNSAGDGGVGGSGKSSPYTNPGAWGGIGGDGGGIFNSGTLTVTASILQGNHAGSGGNGGAGSGGIPVTAAPGAPGGSGGNGGNGGGIYNASNLSLARTTVAGNVTGNGGAGGAGGAGSSAPAPRVPGRDGGVGGTGGNGGNGSAISNTGQATVTNSTLSGNTAGNGGAGANGGKGGRSGARGGNGGSGGSGGNGGNGGNGGIYNYNSLLVAATFTVTSATITANNTGNSGIPGSGGAGGVGTPNGNNGMPGTFGTVGTGGGIALYGGTFSLKNTILANNSTPAFGLGPDCYGMLSSQGFNLIRTLTNCMLGGPTLGDITGQDPKLNALADNGGGTLTHALQLTSPARNAADPAGCKDAAGALLLVDQRGLPRSYGGRCDIGAFELQSSGLFLPLIKR